MNEYLERIAIALEKIAEGYEQPVATGNEETGHGPYYWAVSKPLPYETANNPWGNAKAIWRAVDDGDVMLPNNGVNDAKPVFEKTEGTKFKNGAHLIMFRKVLDPATDCDGERHCVCVGPEGGVVPYRKLELVSLIDDDGWVVDD